jgi:hypothetical protein
MLDLAIRVVADSQRGFTHLNADDRQGQLGVMAGSIEGEWNS